MRRNFFPNLIFIKPSEDIIKAAFFMNFQKKMVFSTYHVIEAKKRYNFLVRTIFILLSEVLLSIKIYEDNNHVDNVNICYLGMTVVESPPPHRHMLPRHTLGTRSHGYHLRKNIIISLLMSPLLK
jgi:hypothetical protein